MTTTTREQIMAAVLATIPTPSGGAVKRFVGTPQAIPAGGLIILREGELQRTAEYLSPLQYEFSLSIDIEIYVQGADMPTQLDSLLMATRAAFSDVRLGGLSDWLEASPPEIDFDQSMVLDTTASTKPHLAARLPLVVIFTTTSDLG